MKTWRTTPDHPGNFFFDHGFVDALSNTTPNPFGVTEGAADIDSVFMGRDGIFGVNTGFPMRMDYDDERRNELAWDVELISLYATLLFDPSKFQSSGPFTISHGEAFTTGCVLDDVCDPLSESAPAQNTYNNILAGSEELPGGAYPYYLFGADFQEGQYDKTTDHGFATVTFDDGVTSDTWTVRLLIRRRLIFWMSNATVPIGLEDDGANPQLFSPFLQFQLEVTPYTIPDGKQPLFQGVTGGLGIGQWTGDAFGVRNPSTSVFLNYDTDPPYLGPGTVTAWNRYHVEFFNRITDPDSPAFFSQPGLFSSYVGEEYLCEFVGPFRLETARVRNLPDPL